MEKVDKRTLAVIADTYLKVSRILESMEQPYIGPLHNAARAFRALADNFTQVDETAVRDDSWPAKCPWCGNLYVYKVNDPFPNGPQRWKCSQTSCAKVFPG
jgi:hypothetical protein